MYKRQEIYSAEFEEFWKAYPRKENKRESFKKWKKAVVDITEKKLLVYTIRFAEKVQRDNTQEKYIPHPTTWLNQGRYEDFKKIETKNSLNNIAG